MKKVYLTGFSTTSLTDTDLADAASAWPWLQEISFETVENDNSSLDKITPSISLSGIQTLYNRCANIHHISFDINDNLPLVNGSLELPTSQPRDREVEQLRLQVHACSGSSTEYHARLVPMLIRLAFPRLKSFRVYSGTGDAWSSAARAGWKHVYRHMDPTEVRELLHEMYAEIVSRRPPPTSHGSP